MAPTDRFNCPRIEELAGLADERLDPRREAALITHLDHCGRCRERLEAVAADADLQRAASAIAANQPVRSAALDTAIDLLKALTPGGPAAAGGSGGPYADLLPWIEPAAPGIGRVGGYRLTRFLGRGGMGLVFAGHEEALNRPVAVKFLNPALATRGEFRERFIREARAIAAVNHSNVVTMLAVAEVQGLPYLVMERVDGMSLDAMLAYRADASAAGEPFGGPDTHRLPQDEVRRTKGMEAVVHARSDWVVDIARQVAAALQAAHAAGLVHQDVKPGNILISADGAVAKLTDFGLACSLTEAASDRLAGTPGTISPEVLAGEKPDPRSDLFGLGCVLYELVVGRPPFPSGSLSSRLATKAIPCATAAPGTLPWLAAVIDRLLATDPAARFQSAAEVERALAAGNAATAARRQPVAALAVPARGMRRMIVAGLISVALVVISLWRLRNAVDAGPVTAASLTEAIRAAPSGAVITIPGGMLLQLEALDLGDRDLTIRSDGSRPVLRFAAGSAPGGRSLLQGTGDLVLEGLSLELVMASQTAPDDACCLIALDGGSLELDDCTLEVAGDSTCISARETARITILGSGLHAPDGTAVDWVPAAGSEATATRSIISGRTGWAVADPLDATLRLDHVTAVVDRLATLRWDELDGPADGRLAIEAESCALSADDALVLLHTDSITAAALEAAVTFRGQDNLIDAEVVMLEDDEGLLLPEWLATGDPGAGLGSMAMERSVFREIPFVGSREMLREWPASAEGEVAEVFTVQPEPDLRDRFANDPPGSTPGWE